MERKKCTCCGQIYEKGTKCPSCGCKLYTIIVLPDPVWEED